MTPDQAIALLKRANELTNTRDKSGEYLKGDVCLIRSEFDALLALLEWLRWRKVSEQKPPGDSRMLVKRFHAGAVMFYWSSPQSKSWLSGDGLWPIDPDDLWLPLSSLLPSAESE